MSAWDIGSQAGRRGVSAATQDQPAWVNRLIKWIPGDVLVLYIAGIAALRTQTPDPNPSWVLLAVGAVAAPVIVLAAWFALGRAGGSIPLLEASLSLPAFLIWAVLVPTSGWYAWTLVRDNPGWIAALIPFIGLLYGWIAQGAAARWGSS